MKFPTFIAATILLGLGANAAAVPDTDAAMAAGIGGNKHYGKCLAGPNQCVINQKHGEQRIDCRGRVREPFESLPCEIPYPDLRNH
ncbi:hypothetical protein K4K59_008736 [Colletotrichum sp. SAR11_240]|nr:hypothetical protein K4K59_008736 [Colletotrichum sp. SAR11_240]